MPCNSFAAGLLMWFACSTAIVADDAGEPPGSPNDADAVPTLFDITPAGVDFVIGFNRLGESFDRAEALNQILGLSIPTGDFRKQFEVGVGEGVVDYRGPLAVFAMSPFEYGDPSVERVGVAVVVNDPRAARHALRVSEEAPDGEILTGKLGAMRFTVPAAFRGNALYASLRNDAMDDLLAQGTLAEQLDADLFADLEVADVVAIARRGRMLDQFWQEFLPGINDSADATTENAEAQPIEDQFRQLVHSVESVAFAGSVSFGDESSERINGGVFRLTMHCDHQEDSESSRLLAGLAANVRPTALEGLPPGEVVVAFAGQFGSASHLSFVRYVTDLSADMWNRARQLPDSLVGEQFLAVFEEAGEHLQGMRLGIYRNEEFVRDGSFALLFVFEAEHPQAFVDEMRQLIRLASADELEKTDEAVLTEDEIRVLVTQLGDRAFRVRRSASNRLMLVGPPAIPFLRDGLESDSLELRTRARVILEQMEALDTYESRHFLGSELFQGLKLEQRYVIAGEQLGDGTPIDFITYSIADEAHQPFAQQLSTWLGPDWNRWRLAATDDHVVVLVGSRTELLTQALDLLNGRGGEGLVIKSWADSNRPHQFEVHLNGNAFQSRDLRAESIDSAGSLDGEIELISIGIGVQPDAVLINAFVPLSQMNSFAFPFGL